MKSFRKLVPVIVVLLALFVFAVPAFAQTTAAVQLVGVVDEMTLDTITVNGQIIDVSTAQINTPIEVGLIVGVEGTLNTDGTITAREVNPVDPNAQPGEVEIIGVLDSFDGTTLVVNGLTIDAVGAEIQAGLTVGEMVKVHARINEAMMWVARQAEPYVPQDPAAQPVVGEFELTGTLEEIGTGYIVVAGQTIDTTEAEITDPLMVGLLVKAHVQLRDGALFAREVHNAFSYQYDNTNSNANDNTNQNQNTNTNDNVDVVTAITAQDAIDIVLGIYPNTTVVQIELTTKFGGTLVWEIKTSHGLEIIIDAQSGVILVIENSSNNNSNSNTNTDDDHGDDDHGNGSNANSNSHDDDDHGSNSNTNSNSNSHDDDDDHDDHDD